MGHIHLRVGPDVQTSMTDVSDHADYSQPGAGDDANALANRVLIGPEGPRHCLVDDDYRRRLRIVAMRRIRLLFVIPDYRQSDPRVGVAEKPAFPQWNSHCAEVVVADAARGGVQFLTGRRRGTTVNGKWEPGIGARKRRHRCGASRFNAGQGFDPLDESLIETHLLSRPRVFRPWKTDVYGQNVLRVESRINVDQMEKALQRQPAADQQD